MTLQRRRENAFRRGSIRYASPFYAGRHPFQVYLLLASFLSGVPLVLSLGTSGTDPAVSPVNVFIWGVMLVGGSTTALLGTYWPVDVVTRMTIERIGLTATGYGALIYGTVTVIETPEISNVVGVAILLAFAGVCLIRSHDIATEIKLWVARSKATK